MIASIGGHIMVEIQTVATGTNRFVRSFSIALASVSLLLWCLAVAMPVWEERSQSFGTWTVIYGFSVAMTGWLGLLVGSPAWLANFLLLPALIWAFRQRGGFWLSVAAFAVAASAYAMRHHPDGVGQVRIMSREIGFYFWLASFFVLVFGNAILAQINKKRGAIVRWLVVVALIASVFWLESHFAIRVSPLALALKNPDDLAAFDNALAQKPSQAELDAGLRWMLPDDMARGHKDPTPAVEKLLAAGANPNQGGHYSLLIHAVYQDCPGVAAALIRAGADVNVRDNRGKSLLEIARESKGSPELFKVLTDAGAVPAEPVEKK